jgi:hypothetical protein
MKICEACGSYMRCNKNRFVKERIHENYKKNPSSRNPLCWHPKDTITVLKEKQVK